MNLTRAFRIKPGEVIALAGGGGKTTTMFRLADELASAGLRVLTTTTTRLFTSQVQLAPVRVEFDPASQTIADILPAVEAALAAHSQVFISRPIEPASSKVTGLPPAIIDALAQHVDVIINEADGARKHPFKAPAGHEPVIPASTTLVVPVVGLDVLGEPLDGDSTHRPELVSRLTGLPLGAPITEETVAAVLTHPQGGLQYVPNYARLVPLLNKAETPGRLDSARQLAAKLLTCERIDSVAIGSVQAAANPVLEVHGRAAAIILAAGGSTRYGSPKQLARWDEQTFIERVADVALASSARPVVAVLGAEVERCRAALGRRPVQVVVNEHWAEGQSTSLRAGLAALPVNINAAVFLLVDQPGISSDVGDALIEHYRYTLAPVVWPEFEGRRGNPVLFDRALFSELNQVRGDTGGRPVLLAYQAQAGRVAVSNPAVLQDVDRAEGRLLH